MAVTPRSVADAADHARTAIDAALADPEVRAVADALTPEERGGASALVRVIADDVEPPFPASARFEAVHERLAADGTLPAAYALERFVLATAARDALPLVPGAPVDPGVQRLVYEEFAMYVAPDARRRPLVAASTPTFRAACQVVAMRRFPAGQLHWDVSGVSRRSLLRMPKRDVPRAAAFIALRMRGFGPALFGHVNGWRRNPFVWLEQESNRSYHRIARALARQPSMLGLVLRAWFHDPDIAAVTPHLAWTNRVVLENGGLVVADGAAGPESGVLANNAQRVQAFESGAIRPKYGLVMWPREALIAWAERNPEYDDT